ncbi:MAG: hypothetical protein AB3N64_08850 [Puniceicoccaceae bacterium]
MTSVNSRVRQCLGILLLCLTSNAAYPDSAVFAASPASFEIRSATSGEPVESIFGNINCWDIVQHPDGHRVFYSVPTAGYIGYFDPRENTPSAEILVFRDGAIFKGLYLDAENDRLYFLDSATDTLESISTGGGSPMVHVSGKADGVIRPNDVLVDGNMIYITDSGADVIWVYDGSGSLIESIPYVGVWGIAKSPTNADLYVSSHDLGEVSLLKGTSLITMVSGLQGPRGLDFDRKGILYCTVSGSGSINQLNFISGTHFPVFSGIAGNGRGFEHYTIGDLDGDFLLDEWELQFASSVLDIDPDQSAGPEGNTYLSQFLYNGSIPSRDMFSVMSGEPGMPGGGELLFEGLVQHALYSLVVSTDLMQWQVISTTPEEIQPIDDYYASYRFPFELPIPDSEESDRYFFQIVGTVAD